MKFSTTTSALLALLTSSVSAQQNTIQSAPFNLVLISANSTINGTTIFPCHEGAAIEGLCVGPTYNASGSFTKYNFNTTNGTTETIPGKGVSGVLTWVLPASNLNVSEGMQFIYSDTSNVAHPQFQPGYGQTYVAFDKNGLMNIQSYVDDTKDPATAGPSTAYYRWYICHSYAQGYRYTTLNWALGRGKPQNPTCVYTNVKRVFTTK